MTLIAQIQAGFDRIVDLIKSMEVGSGGGSTLLNSNTAIAGITNSANVQNLFSETIPLGTLKPGDVLRIKAFGDFRGNTTATLSLKYPITINGTDINATPALSISTSNNFRKVNWDFEIFVIDSVTLGISSEVAIGNGAASLSDIWQPSGNRSSGWQRVTVANLDTNNLSIALGLKFVTTTGVTAFNKNFSYMTKN